MTPTQYAVLIVMLCGGFAILLLWWRFGFLADLWDAIHGRDFQ